MKISIFGTGYVGLTQAACLAEVGHSVCCVDIDVERIALLAQGRSPIYEPGLEALLQGNIAAGRLHFTTSAHEGVAFAKVIYISVGTPPDEDGSADMRHVFAVARTIAEHAIEDKVVINKSTSPVGTVKRIGALIDAALVAQGSQLRIQVVSNPEFLKEGSAVDDCMRPERIIIGIDGECDLGLFREINKPFSRHREKLIFMDSRSAELTKYAANCMLATKISFINEMANLAERLGADIEMVRKGIGSDPRIGYDFIYPGCGYGGSCFPKDIRALQRTAMDIGYRPALLEAVESVNQQQKHKVFQNIERHYQGDLRGKTFALWGLSFKPNTNDMREAPSRVLLESLWAVGARVQAFDPEAMDEARRLYGDRLGLQLTDTKEAALEGANALVILTEWLNFRIADFALIRERLVDRVVFDGRNIFEPVQLAREDLSYYSIGRAVAGASR
ncbi:MULTISPECIES: UDP-glucose dehydrogenase family protein [unclassified Pseudomonas]|uniref:UDP-glucose dehydrogenase family protein n=1 Tax=unclassified Pseudomonas TaxID=196821 RepID=UPI000DA87BEE|nr:MULTISPECIES: UDP-glucose/GDP-mannose dehydrogenase family protein [unclassified Pseudomonas]MDW3713299.1 UDP-glucose/GDP-mannose dehydrogenase family protein [Pseudomonas sp. 2023EL-01195]PZE12015.1 UDP-glucose 6-dehydrogenase [Pseudomonas sp. 57B-090624]